MKQIGQFAKDNNITVKTLHHYEKIGLIMPSFVDQETGYRYYNDSVKTDIQVVLFLKELGLSLSEIKDVIGEKTSKEQFIDFMMFKEKQALNDYENTSKRLFLLQKVITSLKTRELREMNMKELILLNQEDLSTGVYGQSKFREEGELLFAKAKDNRSPLCVMELDLNQFKKVNDNYGYEVGDIVLRRTQDSIISSLQKSKYHSIIERNGGDEFTVIVVANSMETSLLASNILNNVVSIDYSDIAKNLKVSATAGIACITKKTQYFQELLHDATSAMYHNKKMK